MGEQATRDREFGPLERIRDNHPKYVISATPLLTSRNENGIKHISLREFFLKRTLKFVAKNQTKFPRARKT